MATPKTATAIIGAAALLLAIIAAYMVYNYLNTKEQEIAKAKIELRPVVVAAGDIPFGTRLQAIQLKVVGWPSTSMPNGYASAPSALEGRLTIASVPAGVPVLDSSLAPEKGEMGAMSFIVPVGHRAITVAVNDVVGVAGFVLPNSIVDIVATVASPYGGGMRTSKIVLQNIKVLAVGQMMEQKEGKPMQVPTVTLDVTPEQAEKLIVASEERLQLILKHIGDNSVVSTHGETVASLLGEQAPAPVAKRVSSVRPHAKPAAAPVQRDYIEVIRGNSRTVQELK